jgi:hypothetical protein
MTNPTIEKCDYQWLINGLSMVGMVFFVLMVNPIINPSICKICVQINPSIHINIYWMAYLSIGLPHGKKLASQVPLGTSLAYPFSGWLGETFLSTLDESHLC